jgi:hypothetical protein
MQSAPSRFEPLWSELETIEGKAITAIAKQIAAFELPVRLCFEAGCLAPTLEGQRRGTIDLSITGMFLKRVLTDLRTIWLLLVRGYTTQAGSLAATLFENALVVAVVAGNEARAKEIQRADGIPWSTQELTKMQAAIWTKDAIERGQPYTKKEQAEAWQLTYFQYKWMCQLKHPSPQTVKHDASATLVDDRNFAVVVLPDVRKENLPVKIAMLGSTLHRAIEAIKRFALAMNCDKEHAKYKRFDELLSVATAGLGDAMKAAGIKNNPIQVFDRRFIKF